MTDALSALARSGMDAAAEAIARDFVKRGRLLQPQDHRHEHQGRRSTVSEYIHVRAVLAILATSGCFMALIVAGTRPAPARTVVRTVTVTRTITLPGKTVIRYRPAPPSRARHRARRQPQHHHPQPPSPTE